MYPIRLKSRVDINGPDFWGFESKISFCPTLRHGWRWGLDVIYPVIGPEIIDSATRRLRLSFRDKKLEIYEHIGILRWFGLCQVLINSSSWYPYYGRSLEIWQKIKPFCEEDAFKKINWYTIKEPVRWEYPGLRNGQKAFTEIFPSNKPKLEVRTIVSYPGLDTHALQFSLPNTGFLEKICSVHNQGWPKYLYYLSKGASFFGWPHHRTAVWVQELGEKEALNQFALHRAADLLGGLSLLCKDGLFAGRVISQCSGHQADMQAILKANKLLYPL